MQWNSYDYVHVNHTFIKHCILGKKWSICDTIKGKGSHVGNIQFWFFNINYRPLQNATYWSKPHLNRASDCWDMNSSLKFLNNLHVSTEHTLSVVAVCLGSFRLECPVETQTGNKFTERHMATEHPLTNTFFFLSILFCELFSSVIVWSKWF